MKIVDRLVMVNVDLEWKVKKDSSERLRNEHHLIIEKRVMDIEIEKSK